MEWSKHIKLIEVVSLKQLKFGGNSQFPDCCYFKNLFEPYFYMEIAFNTFIMFKFMFCG